MMMQTTSEIATAQIGDVAEVSRGGAESAEQKVEPMPPRHGWIHSRDGVLNVLTTHAARTLRYSFGAKVTRVTDFNAPGENCLCLDISGRDFDLQLKRLDHVQVWQTAPGEKAKLHFIPLQGPFLIVAHVDEEGGCIFV